MRTDWLSIRRAIEETITDAEAHHPRRPVERGIACSHDINR
jgi:hypothetical protein